MSRRPRRMMNQINVVPYIDVMLVLLVIFMITAPLVNPGQIELPQVGSALGQPSVPIEITIRVDGRLSVRDRAVSAKDDDMALGDIVDLVKRAQSKNPQQSVVIAADKSVRYEGVIAVMDALQQARIRKIGLLAKPRKG
jgi:biopolymer transport protein TolR